MDSRFGRSSLTRSKALNIMSSKMNWPAHNRQEKLWRWIRQHGNYAWLETLPAPNETEIDRWAKRQVRKSVARVRRAQEKIQIKSKTPDGFIALELEVIETALADEDLKTARLSGEKILNFLSTINLTSIDNQLRSQILETISLLLAIEE